MNTSPEIRIVDANINRINEGLRLLDDIARFILNDALLSKSIKEIRHSIINNTAKLGIRLLDARDVSRDWGSTSTEKSFREDLLSLVSANARRAEEGLRVIEEIAKLKDFNKSLNASAFKKARFEVYELERILASRISRRQASAKIKGLYVVIDIDYIGNKDPFLVASQAIAGSANIIQLRYKCGDKKVILDKALKLQQICSAKKVIFIVNDYVDVALACDADGVHLGQSDLPVKIARKLMPIDKLIGCSAATFAEARQAERDGADYIAVGAIFPTSSKDDITVVGLDRLKKIKESIKVPVVAIGGINRKNLARTILTGANSAAVISAVLSAPDVQKAASSLASIISKASKNISK